MCGIIGVISKKRDVVFDAMVLLGAEENRGGQGCGIGIVHEGKLYIRHGQGKVGEERKWVELHGSECVMHTLYSNLGNEKDDQQSKVFQPIPFKFLGQDGVIVHNGNLVNDRLDGLRREAVQAGYIFKSEISDTEVIAALLSVSKQQDFLSALIEVLKKIEGKGSFSLVVLYGGKLYGVRDQNGIRPLCVIKQNGRNGDNDSYILASETSIFTSLEATRVIKLVDAGELVVIDAGGIERSITWTDCVKKALCVNEYVYFANPGTELCKGCSVYKIRLALGRMCAKNHPAKADVVCAVPDAGRGLADGFAQESGIVNLQGIIKNPSVGRTFLMPRHTDRAALQLRKLQAMPEVMEDKRVVLCDDSIFRSSVGSGVAKISREHGGAKEIHMRIGSPPVIGCCHLGLDVPTLGELVASSRTIEQTREFVHIDSLEYLTMEEFKQVFSECGVNPDHLCMGCYTGGGYPVPPPIK